MAIVLTASELCGERYGCFEGTIQTLTWSLPVNTFICELSTKSINFE